MAYINNLFQGSGQFTEAEKNEVNVLVVDEAHRLNAKSGMFQNLGENQIKEIINASNFSIFFIDEDQKNNQCDRCSGHINVSHIKDRKIDQAKIEEIYDISLLETIDKIADRSCHDQNSKKPKRQKTFCIRDSYIKDNNDQ